MKRLSSWVVLLSLIIVPLVFSACSKQSSRHSKNFRTKHWKTYGAAGLIPASDVPLVINDKVMAWLDYFTGASRDRFGRYMQRSGRYIEQMRETLKKNGLPADLVYVAMIESGFSTGAYSSAAAVGCWQFIGSTGRRYGLDRNQWLDERRDPAKATVAAARYLKDLYNEFGDWYLAMAGYNAGEGRVRQAIAAVGSKDFWTLTESKNSPFKAETRDYVPKFIAAAIIAKQPEKFGFNKVDYHAPLTYDTSTVDSQTDLEVVAKCAGASEEDIKLLNPELIAGSTPPGNYDVRIPVGSREKFKVAFAKIPESERIVNLTYAVAKHDNLDRISKRFGVSPGAILAANGLSSPKKLHRGMVLTIPRGKGVSTEIGTNDPADVTAKSKKSGGSLVAQYQVRSGDTLSKVAGKYNVSVADLRKWNDLSKTEKVKKGQIIKVYRNDTKYDAVASLSERAEPAKKNKKTEVVSSNSVEDSNRPKSVQQVIARAQSADNYDYPNTVQSPKEKADAIAKSEAELNPQPDSANAALTDSNAAAQINNDVAVNPATTSGDKVEKKSRQSSHVVKSGDTLSSIAKKYNVSIDDLKKWNKMTSSSKIVSGKKLVVNAPTKDAKNVREVKEARQNNESKIDPSASDRLGLKPVAKPGVAAKTAVASAKSATKTQAVATKSYKVKSGDTVWDISKKTNIPSAKIIQMNNLKGGAVKPGQVLTLTER